MYQFKWLFTVLQWYWDAAKCMNPECKRCGIIYCKLHAHTHRHRYRFPLVHIIAIVFPNTAWNMCTLDSRRNKGEELAALYAFLENLPKPVLQEQYRPAIHHNRPEQINKLEKIARHKRLARNCLSKLLEACIWPIRTPSFCKGEYLIDASWHHWHIPSEKL